jgi:hypothetical protein
LPNCAQSGTLQQAFFQIQSLQSQEHFRADEWLKLRVSEKDLEEMNSEYLVLLETLYTEIQHLQF